MGTIFSRPGFVAGLASFWLAQFSNGVQAQDCLPGHPSVEVVSPTGGSAKRVRVQLVTERIVRVSAVPGTSLELPASLGITAPQQCVKYSASNSRGDRVITTSRVRVRVSLATGAVRFQDIKGRDTLAEENRAPFDAREIDGQRFYAVRQQWNRGTDEALYGLGQHQNAQMNYNGEDVELAQHNMDVAIPFLVSSRNYGLLWDNPSITRFGNPRAYGLASRDLELLDADGKKGGLTARYYAGKELKLTRIERDVNYQYIKDLAAWPANLKQDKVPDQRVEWEGALLSDKAGTHRFRLYSSGYVKLFVDGKLVLTRWRQNWNPWYHNVDVPMVVGKPVKIRIEWSPDSGYIALLHNDPLAAQDLHSVAFASEVARAIDYYYIAGTNLDDVIAGYRELTGKAVMAPLWAYGFWQSRQRYKTQDELLDVVREYRKRGIGLDSIVLDWFYWRENDWGSHRFEPSRFPNPKAMLDEVHALHANFMISVWPKFYPNTKNFRELDAKGFMYHGSLDAGDKDWVGPGYVSSFYDPYAEEARKIYWRQIAENLGVLGVDAWWLDCVEPDIHSNLDVAARLKRQGPTAMGPAAEFFNSYPLVHSGGVYTNQRVAKPDKRVMILTRSAYTGQQRYGTTVWSGDLTSRWDDLRDQVSAGVNFSMSGIPNWTFDIGGFAVERRFEQPKPNEEDLAEWRESNLRWFQFGAFAPVFRSHGEFPFREIYNLAPEGSEVYGSLVAYNRLRYRLMPYIYTLAADTWHRDSTMMRGLVMDFPGDPRVRNINTQYLLGPAFLVNPVVEYKARTRKVYLPAGASWYDFYTGARYEGGREINAAAPLARMPLFVKAGSIVPVGPEIQYTAEKPDAPITLLVYTGRNGSFDLYEDDGVSNGYERGEYARIPLRYNERTHTLMLGARVGAFKGLVVKRRFNVRWISTETKNAGDLDAAANVSINYEGAPINVRR